MYNFCGNPQPEDVQTAGLVGLGQLNSLSIVSISSSSEPSYRMTGVREELWHLLKVLGEEGKKETGLVYCSTAEHWPM